MCHLLYRSAYCALAWLNVYLHKLHLHNNHSRINNVTQWYIHVLNKICSFVWKNNPHKNSWHRSVVLIHFSYSNLMNPKRLVHWFILCIGYTSRWLWVLWVFESFIQRVSSNHFTFTTGTINATMASVNRSFQTHKNLLRRFIYFIMLYFRG